MNPLQRSLTSIILKYSYCIRSIKRQWPSVFSISKHSVHTAWLPPLPSSFSVKSIDEEVGGEVICYFFNPIICGDSSVWFCHFLTSVTYLKLLWWYFFSWVFTALYFTWFKRKFVQVTKWVHVCFGKPITRKLYFFHHTKWHSHIWYDAWFRVPLGVN